MFYWFGRNPTKFCPFYVQIAHKNTVFLFKCCFIFGELVISKWNIPNLQLLFSFLYFHSGRAFDIGYFCWCLGLERERERSIFTENVWVLSLFTSVISYLSDHWLYLRCIFKERPWIYSLVQSRTFLISGYISDTTSKVQSQTFCF